MSKNKYHSIDGSALDIGAILSAFIKRKRLHISVLARNIDRGYQTVFDYKKQKSLQTAIVWELSYALKHNFFADIAAMLPLEFGTDAPVDTTNAELIVSLQKELDKVTTERDVLLQAMRK